MPTRWRVAGHWLDYFSRRPPGGKLFLTVRGWSDSLPPFIALCSCQPGTSQPRPPSWELCPFRGRETVRWKGGEDPVCPPGLPGSPHAPGRQKGEG